MQPSSTKEAAKFDPKAGEAEFVATGLFVAKNDVEENYDGGTVNLSLNAVPGTDIYEDEKVVGLTVVVNYRMDGPMRRWPWLRDDKQKYEYEVRISRRPVAK